MIWSYGEGEVVLCNTETFYFLFKHVNLQTNMQDLCSWSVVTHARHGSKATWCCQRQSCSLHWSQPQTGGTSFVQKCTLPSVTRMLCITYWMANVGLGILEAHCANLIGPWYWVCYYDPAMQTNNVVCHQAAASAQTARCQAQSNRSMNWTARTKETKMAGFWWLFV